jgi:predicted helicase
MVEKYKFIDGVRMKEKGALQMEKNLNDDYVKFLALGEHLINTTGEGVLAFINNNNYLDGPTLRGMRWNLTQSFTSIYILDLKGSATRKDKAADGSKDENVFDIQQGVCINLFVRNPAQRKSRVFYASMQGTRESKYDQLESGRIRSLDWKELRLQAPYYEMVPRDYGLQDAYNRGFSIAEMFPTTGTGIISARDNLVIDFESKPIVPRIEHFRDSAATNAALCAELDISLKKGWDIDRSRRSMKLVTDVSQFIVPIHYRPFDSRMVFYHEALIWTSVRHVMKHFNLGLNVGLVFQRQAATDEWSHVLTTSHLIDNRFQYSNKGIPVTTPLYLYDDSGSDTLHAKLDPSPNVSSALVEQLAKGVGLTYTFKPEALFAHGTGKELTPLDVLDYCYAVLHSPAYRAKYKEFLKSDFPRIPFPTDAKKFRALVQLGGKLRQLHLLEWEGIDKYITQYPVGGNNAVTKKMGKGDFTDGKVWINDTQYFANVPDVAWNFYIGGYQPAQKWLKDRHGRTLTFDDIRHYQRMIVALNETAKVMEEVDEVGVV